MRPRRGACAGRARRTPSRGRPRRSTCPRPPFRTRSGDPGRRATCSPSLTSARTRRARTTAFAAASGTPRARSASPRSSRSPPRPARSATLGCIVAARGRPAAARPAVRRRRLPALARATASRARRRAAGSPTGPRGSPSASCSASSSPAGCCCIQRAAGDLWPLPAWAAAVAFGGLLAALFPVLLLPLFLKSERMAEGDLAEAMWATARAAGVNVRELRLLKMGEKTAAGERHGCGARADGSHLRLRHAGRARGGRDCRPRRSGARASSSPTSSGTIAPRHLAAPRRLGRLDGRGSRRRLGRGRGPRAGRRRPRDIAAVGGARLHARLGRRLAVRRGVRAPPRAGRRRIRGRARPGRGRRSRARSSGSSPGTSASSTRPGGATCSPPSHPTPRERIAAARASASGHVAGLH